MRVAGSLTVIFLLVTTVSACVRGVPEGAAPSAQPTPAIPAPDQTPPPPPPAARTVEQFDTTTTQQRVAAASPQTGGARLGVTVASLGDPTEPGFWAKTPLVSKVTPGRLEYGATGKSVQVELRPSGGAAGSGSQVSLAALRVLEAPLTALPELVVHAR